MSKYALTLAEDGRVLSATYPKYAAPDAVIVPYIPVSNITDYIYQDGVYHYDPLPKPEPAAPEPTVWEELDAAYQEGVDAAYDE